MLRHLFFASAFCVAAFAQADVYYTARPEISSRSLLVTVRVDAAPQRAVFQIPVWTPGFYYVLNFQNNLTDVHATGSDGAELAIDNGGSKWTVENPSGGPVTLHYKVAGDDAGLGFFRTHLGEKDCYVNGASAFMYVEGRKTEPCHLSVRLPEGWKIATPMDPEGDGFVATTGYDEFIDHPIQMGQFQRRDFEVRGIPFSAIFVANDSIAADLDKAAERLKVCSEPAIDLFGKAAFKRYFYFIHLAVGDFSGGLEHRASNVIATSNTAPLYLNELGTHEYFHAWNVKQIRPKVLGPFDYTQKVVTGNLWFSEGVTDYYAYITAHRARIQPDHWLLDSLSRQIQELQTGTTRKEMSVEECSRQAWISGFGNVGDLSYYNKGLVAGLIFDGVIRAQTKGAKSLDDVLRLMFERYRLPKPGFEEDAIRAAINEVAGADLSTLYNRMIRSTEELPYSELKGLGLRVRLLGDQARGLGFETWDGEVGKIASATYAAGLRENDKIVSIDGRPFVGAGDLFDRKQSFVATVLRNGHQLQLRLPIVQTRVNAVTLEPDPFANPDASARFTEWIRR